MTPGHSVQTLTSGIRLSLTAERDVYPRDALIRVTVRIENVADVPVTVQEFRYWHPSVTVETQDGHRVSDSAHPLWTPPSVGPVPTRHTTLSPGEAVEQPLYVILRAERLRAHVGLVGIGYVDGEPLALTLTESPPLEVRLVTDSEIYAKISPPPGAGPLLYQAVSRCREADSSSFSGNTQWVEADDNRIRPEWREGCLEDRTWSVLAGYLDHPVASIEYRES